MAFLLAAVALPPADKILLSAGAEPSAYSFPPAAAIEVLAGAALVAYAVHGKDHNRPLEPFEAEYVAVEHVVTGEERIPVAVPAVVVEDLLLQLVLSAGHQQGDLPRLPALAVAFEHPLRLIQEREQAPGLLVAQARQRGRPPHPGRL